MVRFNSLRSSSRQNGSRAVLGGLSEGAMAARRAKASHGDGHGTRRRGVVEITRADSQATGLQRRRPSGGLGVDSKAPSEIQTPAGSWRDIARWAIFGQDAFREKNARRGSN